MDKDAKISRFWDKYIQKTVTYGIKEKNVRWYVRHAELYINSQNTRLALHTPQTVDNYLEAKGRNTVLKDWIYGQIVDALRILFVDVVRADWAADYPWDDRKSQARSLPSFHPTIARQSPDNTPLFSPSDVTCTTIQEKFPAVFDALVSAIRIRNYSIRTEQSYAAWLARFILFNQQNHPDKLVANDIARYLTYLAVNRMVASSTQRQALNAIVFYYKNVLNKSFEDIGDFSMAKRPKRLPVVLSRDEVDRLLKQINDPVYHLMASLLYGYGMRLMDPVRSK